MNRSFWSEFYEKFGIMVNLFGIFLFFAIGSGALFTSDTIPWYGAMMYVSLALLNLGQLHLLLQKSNQEKYLAELRQHVSLHKRQGNYTGYTHAKVPVKMQDGRVIDYGNHVDSPDVEKIIQQVQSRA